MAGHAHLAIGSHWPALIGAAVPLASIEATIDGNPRASMRHETALRRPDGSTVPVRMTFSALRSGEGERLGLISACEDLSAIRAMESRMRQADRLATLDGNPRASLRHETALRRPDGSTVPVRMTFSALQSGEGERLGLISACEDLSAIRAMESRMRQADRLATVGRMAANIAHEIRNPLASLTGAIEVLTSPHTAEDSRERLSQIVARESERLNHIIKNFLEYARPAPLSITTFDVAAAAEEVLLLLEHRASPGSLKVIREFPPSLLWPVDGQQFRQILWNLCLNAVEAMPEGGELRVAAAVRGGTLEITVTDTGEGIAAGDVSHVFEPFFSTKSEGTGLGLALVHRVVQEHGGEIDVRSSPGLGTTFTLTLPSHHA